MIPACSHKIRTVFQGAGHGGDVKSIRFGTEHLEGRPRQQMKVNGCRTAFKTFPKSILNNMINPDHRLAKQEQN